MEISKQLSKLLNLKNSKQEKYLRSIFFELIQGNNGSITVMEFAMQADITGQEARKCLEQYAIEFEANFDTTDEGHVVYLFPVVNQAQSNSANSSESPQKTPRKITVTEKNNSLQEKIEAKINIPKVKNVAVDFSAVEKDIQDIGKKVREIGDSFKF